MESERRVRRATSGDVAFISECTRRAYSKYVPVLGRPARPVTADYAMLLTQAHIWILEVGANPAGLIVLQEQAGALLIYSVAVDPDYQGQGHGAFLMRIAEEQAAGLGLARVRLYTNALMEQNLELYRKLGYREVGQESYQGSVLLRMDKRLGT